MDNHTKLWPLEQLFQWLHTCNTKKYCCIPKIALPTLIALVKFANNQTWECDPSFPSLENLSMLSHDTIVEHIKVLEDAQIISVIREKGIRNKYKILTNNFWKEKSICKFKQKPVGKSDYPSRKIRLPQSENPTRTSSLTNSVTKKNEIEKKYEPKPSAKKASTIVEEYMKGKQIR